MINKLRRNSHEEHHYGDDEADRNNYQTGRERMGYALNPSHQRPADEARRFPVELINATPAAAPAPPRKEVGRAQNIGKDVMMPAVATVSPIMAIKGLLPIMHRAESPEPRQEPE